MYVCTAHLQRDAKHLARKSNDKEAKILYGKLSKLLHRARIWSIENIQRDNVKDIHTRFTKADNCIILQYLLVMQK